MLKREVLSKKAGSVSIKVTSSRFRMPAEWEKHEATWLGWPHNVSDWPGKLAAIHWVYCEIVRKIARDEWVRILVNSANHEGRVRRFLMRVGINLDSVEFFRIPTNRCWVRDFGPIFVKCNSPEQDVAMVRFCFNGWARYKNFKKDDQVSSKIATKLQYPLFRINHNNCGVVLEGGSIDVNGRGTALATEECLLDRNIQVRNPGFSTIEYELVLKNALGILNVVWLNKGIVGDDTHGHVDDVCRFVNANTVVLCQERNVYDANYRLLVENRERLEAATLEDGSKFNIIPLPMPDPLYFEGRRLPASYANFYICNSGVFVPTFNDANDRVALGIIGDLFPDRPVIGIHSVDLVWGLGTIHCLTQQQPARVSV